jgi:hypothetical protein
MLADELWLMEELSADEPSELLRSLPEIRRCFEPERSDDEVGLRAILDRPEALSKAWRRQARRARTPRARPLRRVGGALDSIHSRT